MLTDIIIGQGGSDSHAHITVSEVECLYFRDVQDKEIVKKHLK